MFWVLDEGSGHIQSLVLGTSMAVASLLCFSLLVIADLQRTNRIILEETLERTKHLQYGPARHVGVVRATAEYPSRP